MSDTDDKLCPVCGSERTGEFWPHVWGSPDKTVHVCATCRSFFIWPQSTADEQAAFDQDYAAYIDARAAEVAVHIDSSFDDMVDDSIEKRWADIGHWFKDAQTVLEIGAEKGGFLDRLRADGPKTSLVGVDACPAYTELLAEKGYAAFAYVEDVPEDKRFERVCFFSLLEHILDPVAFLRRTATHLEPGGLMVIEVPLSRDPLVSIYDIDAFKNFYFQAMHPYVFGLEALDLLLERSGLMRVDVRFKQRYGLANHLQWLKEGAPGGSSALSAIFDGAAEGEYIAALEKAETTDTVYVAAKLNPDTGGAE